MNPLQIVILSVGGVYIFEIQKLSGPAVLVVAQSYKYTTHDDCMTDAKLVKQFTSGAPIIDKTKTTPAGKTL